MTISQPPPAILRSHTLDPNPFDTPPIQNSRPPSPINLPVELDFQRIKSNGRVFDLDGIVGDLESGGNSRSESLDRSTGGDRSRSYSKDPLFRIRREPSADGSNNSRSVGVWSTLIGLVSSSASSTTDREGIELNQQQQSNSRGRRLSHSIAPEFIGGASIRSLPSTSTTINTITNTGTGKKVLGILNKNQNSQLVITFALIALVG